MAKLDTPDLKLHAYLNLILNDSEGDGEGEDARTPTPSRTPSGFITTPAHARTSTLATTTLTEENTSTPKADLPPPPGSVKGLGPLSGMKRGVCLVTAAAADGLL